jgi:hypothetical protein
MSKRHIPVLAAVACLCVGSAPAFATDDPPQAPPANGTAPAPGPGVTPPGQPAPASCVDTTRPSSRVLTTSRTAIRSHTLRGTATDTGCTPGASVALVSVSIALKQGAHCKYLTRQARLSRSGTCKTPRWISATGTKRWRLRLPAHMARGSYQILTRAVDSAGNVERAHARRLAIRQPRSTHKKK